MSTPSELLRELEAGATVAQALERTGVTRYQIKKWQGEDSFLRRYKDAIAHRPKRLRSGNGGPAPLEETDPTALEDFLALYEDRATRGKRPTISRVLADLNKDKHRASASQILARKTRSGSHYNPEFARRFEELEALRIQRIEEVTLAQAEDGQIPSTAFKIMAAHEATRHKYGNRIEVTGTVEHRHSHEVAGVRTMLVDRFNQTLEARERREIDVTPTGQLEAAGPGTGEDSIEAPVTEVA